MYGPTQFKINWATNNTMENFAIKKGDKFVCLEDVTLRGEKTVLYKKNHIYTSEADNCITDELGDTHRTWTYEVWDDVNWPDHFTRAQKHCINSCNCPKCSDQKPDKDYFQSVQEEFGKPTGCFMKESDGTTTHRQFDTGAVRDSNEGKPLIHTLLGYTRQRFGYHMAKNAKKYGPLNFLKGIPTEAALESLDRHLAAYMAGDRSEDHLSAILFGTQCCMLNEKREEGIEANHYFK